MPAVRDQPAARATSGCERWRAEGVAGLADRSRAPRHHPQAVAAELARGLPCAAARASDLGAGEGAGVRSSGGAPAGRWPAASTIGALFDREGLTVKRRLRRRAPPGGPLFAADGGQRRLDHRLQGLVPHRRRHPRRPADARRRLQPLSAALPGGGAPRHRACLADPRRRLPRVRPAAAAALRQRPALRDDRRGRALAALGQGDQGRRHPRAHHPRQAAGERPARAAAPDAAAGHRRARRPRPCGRRRSGSAPSGPTYNEERPHAALGNATPAERYAASPRRWDGVLRAPEPAADDGPPR